MLSKFIFSLINSINLLFMMVLMLVLSIFDTAFGYLSGGGTPLKTCTPPPFWALVFGLNKTLYSGLMALSPGPVPLLNNNLNLDTSGEPPFIDTTGLPFRAGAIQSPSGQFAY